MATNRIEQLQKFYEADPGDPFNIYALAIEYLNDAPLTSRSLFEKLLTEHKTYLPTYYHAAKLYHELGEHDKAVAVYEEGMTLARDQNNAKALRELRSAYDEMMFE